MQMKFVEAILSNNTTDDHCREFVTQKGLVPLMNILSLPNLPLDFPTTHSCQAVASVCKSILVRYLMFQPNVMYHLYTSAQRNVFFLFVRACVHPCVCPKTLT